MHSGIETIVSSASSVTRPGTDAMDSTPRAPSSRAAHARCRRIGGLQIRAERDYRRGRAASGSDGTTAFARGVPPLPTRDGSAAAKLKVKIQRPARRTTVFLLADGAAPFPRAGSAKC
jgi:hypothetical protein